MATLALICLAGAAGSGARYLVAVGAARWLGLAFPYGTLAVNLTGSFLLGLVAQLGVAHAAISPELRAVLGTGFLGGFTTYSSFNQELMTYLRHGPRRIALLYGAATLLGGITAAALGAWAGQWAAEG